MRHTAHDGKVGYNKYATAFSYSDLLSFLLHGINCDIVSDSLTNGIVPVM